MKEFDEALPAHFQRQRAQDESRAPSFTVMSSRARVAGVAAEAAPHRTWLLWLGPAATAFVLATVILRPHSPAALQYSDRIAALISELDAPIFAQTEIPSDLLPRAFPQP